MQAKGVIGGNNKLTAFMQKSLDAIQHGARAGYMLEQIPGDHDVEFFLDRHVFQMLHVARVEIFESETLAHQDQAFLVKIYPVQIRRYFMKDVVQMGIAAEVIFDESSGTAAQAQNRFAPAPLPEEIDSGNVALGLRPLIVFSFLNHRLDLWY
jgi:hypothetical protein